MVCLMWLGILPDLILFYLTCLVGPTLLGKTVLSILEVILDGDYQVWIAVDIFQNIGVVQLIEKRL